MRFTLSLLTLSFFCAAVAAGSVSAADATGKGFPLSGAAATPAVAVTPAAATVTVTPSASTASVPFENQPIRFPDSSSLRRSRAAGDSSFQMPSILPVLFAVVVTCALFGAVLYIMKKYLPGHKQMFAHPAMEFLGRTHLDQRRFVSLLRVGRRIVVVGVSSDDMHTLSEITDEAEVTEILEVARPKTEGGLTMFQKLFQRNVIDIEAAQAKAEAEEKTAELDEQMSGLRQRVRELRADAPAARAQTLSPPATRHVDAVG